MKKKSLGLNAILNGLQSLLNMIFPLITFPYISRVLSVDGVGKYNFASSINNYFLMIAALGISTFAVREGAKLRDSREKISEFASEVFTLNMVSTIVSYILLILLLLLTPKLHRYIFAILIFSIQIVFTTLGTDWIYIIFEEYGYITVRNIIFKIISVIFLFVFVREPDDYLNYAAITVFATSGSYILNFFHAKKFCDINVRLKVNWKKYLPPILTIFASTVAIQIYTSSDITILGILKNDYIVGIYSASTKIYNIIKGALAAMTAVAIPRLAMLMGKEKTEEYNSLLSRLINITIIVFLPSMVGLFMLSSDVIRILSGYNYLRAATSLRILCFGMILSALAGIFNQCVLIPAKREKKTLLNTIIGATLNIFLNIQLIPKFSENGSALATVFAELIMVILNFYYGRDLLKPVFKDNKVFKNFFNVLISSVFIILICLACQMFINSIIIRLIVSTVCSVCVYIIVLILTKNSLVLDIISNLKMSLSNR
mgnify:CR=1 FL=1